MTAEKSGPCLFLDAENKRTVRQLKCDNLVETTPADLPAEETVGTGELSPMSVSTTYSDLYDVSISLESSTFDFADLDLSYSLDAPVWIETWRICLAGAALFDFLAAVAVNVNQTGITIGFGDAFEEEWNVVGPSSTYLGGVLTWLQSHTTLFGFIFSFLWFADAFVTAHERRVQKIQDRESEILLNDGEGKFKDGHRLCNAWGVYYRTMALQLLLLPVGFFVVCFGILRRLHNREFLVHDQVLQVVHKGEQSINVESFDTNSKLSLLFVVIKHVTIMISLRTGSHVRQHILQKLKHATRYVAIHALRNPFRFVRLAVKALRWIRWARYLAPLLGMLAKLKGNSVDLLKKIKQTRDANKAKKVRMKLWDRLSGQELKEYCAILIQRTYRSKMSRKYLRALNMIRGETETIAALKVQKIFRSNLRRARARLKRKKLELQMLEERDQEARTKSSITITFSERKRMYQLRQELKYETKKLLNERLLLRPNTTFAVAWKVFFVFAILLEIAQLAFQPQFQKYKQPHSEGPVSIETVLSKTITPSVPLWERPECRIVPERGLMRSKIVRNLWHRVVRRQTRPRPWYCWDLCAKMQHAWVVVVASFVHVLFVLIGIVFFSDVFVTFFTGEYNSETGVLQPKSFFERWIVPGLLLQLLVNPQMASTSKALVHLIITLIHNGPVRVLRWTNALFFPASAVLLRPMKKFWINFVRFQNRNGVPKQLNNNNK